MKLTKLLTVAATTVFGLASWAGAQSTNNGRPAELPPSSFTGGQFVDSRGCIFIRAGIDGNTTWVPRVTRQRQPICNATPTFGSRVAAAPARPAPAPAPRPAPAA
ncbi:MAG: SPOR domain-containing protein, partial [Pseudomonadota bacterium]